MALSKQAIYFIGRLRPQIFDILGNPYGPYRVGHTAIGYAIGTEASLNPQPLPPEPEPDPWRAALARGIQAGHELVRLAFTAQKLGLRFDIDIDDWCPTRPRVPIPVPDPWPWVFPPVPGPRDDFAGEAHQFQLAGLALALELSTDLWDTFESAELLEKVHGTALERAGATDLVGVG